MLWFAGVGGFGFGFGLRLRFEVARVLLMGHIVPDGTPLAFDQPWTPRARCTCTCGVFDHLFGQPLTSCFASCQVVCQVVCQVCSSVSKGLTPEQKSEQ